MSKTQYVDRAWFTRSPNGIYWMLKGRILYDRIGRRHQFAIYPFGHRRAPRWGFGFGPRCR